MNGMFVTQMAFHALISDPMIGGTYMTLLNTMSNLGESRQNDDGVEYCTIPTSYAPPRKPASHCKDFGQLEPTQLQPTSTALD